MIIDAHFHLIERITSFSGAGEGRSLGDGRIELATGEIVRIIPESYKADCFTAEMAINLMNQFHIDMAVLLQGGFYGFQNSYIMQIAQKYPKRFYPVGTLDPYSNQSEQILSNLIDTLGFRALKFELSSKYGLIGYHLGFKIDGNEMQPIFERANENRLTLVFDVGGRAQSSYQIEGFARMIKQYSNIRFVMCHLLCPNSSDKNSWEQDIQQISADNVWFDISALPSFVGEQAPYTNSLNYISKALNLLGSGRLLWGSDAPYILTRYSFEDLFEYCQNTMPSSVLDDVFWKNALTAYNMLM